ncbi:VCBS repeat-containing protein [Aestuariivivens sediminis]|uniref:VCBS repeat-containing protein n=1 Tax=Aestuariivivens sediminis TaxID=2913557 RepID=UPI001F56B4E7|nr:VCBS repeat-containing protein [Aestuariivivens sediminis]
MKLHIMLVALVFVACSAPTKENKQLLNLLSPEITGINFVNEIRETEKVNYFTYPYLYMGGGTAIGDFNNDGLEDIFFTANQNANRLFINKGNWRFDDITQKAGVSGDDRWYTGVSLVDINADGWMDIYLSVAGRSEPHDNELYINNGDLTFTEKAKDYGIADKGFSYQGTFFDYDADGDLDLLVINYTPTNFNSQPEYYKYKIDNVNPSDSDHLYENVNGKFIDITEEAGISNFGLTISSSISDFNNDGLQDIYLCNDFGSPDFLYLNNGDKTFREVSTLATNHTAMYSMGSDVADFDDDGLMDFIQLDMNPPDNYRNKVNMASMNIPLFWAQVANGLHYQYMHNVLQLNSGIIDSIPRFSDVSQLTGISSTDWSWSVLALDIDNNTSKDLFITNGTRRDINNRDFFNNVDKGMAFASPKRVLEESKKIPSEAISNYLFRNKGDLNFEDISSNAGIDQPSFSNGMAYGDLDNDGDLDIVINNIDQEAFVYENTTAQVGGSNYLKVKLKGDSGNLNGIGSRIKIITNKGFQILDQMPVRGYQSTVSNVLHFGLGSENEIDTLKITWPDGTETVKTNLAANQTLILDKSEAVKSKGNLSNSNGAFFKSITAQENDFIDFVHKENDFDDFEVQILLPHKMSQFGPAMVVADLNNDHLDDLFLGGSSGSESALYFQTEAGKFIKEENELFLKYIDSEDVDALAFDFDNDNDLDIYIVSGGNEFEPNNINYKDRLLINNGKGVFSDGTSLLPDNRTSGSVIRSHDFDSDGDLDIFIGTRHLPHNYPFSQSSYIYENDNNQFIDVTEKVAPDLQSTGMITDAVWVDLNSDNKIDLVIVGEWMEPRVLLQNSDGQFAKANNEDLGLENMSGWWYSIEKGDLDDDGDMDLVLGNLGDNYKYQATATEPFKLYAKDFNNSGSTDIVLSYPQGGNYYPVRGKQCSSQQIPELKEKFKDYNSFANADIEVIYADLGLQDALELNANNFSSYILQNNGGKFIKKRLPNYAQISSINDILIDDFDDDGIKDVIVAGNLYTSEVETTRNDASYGSLIKFTQNIENLRALKPSETGLFVRGDCKKINKIKIGDSFYVIAAINDAAISLNRIL